MKTTKTTSAEAWRPYARQLCDAAGLRWKRYEEGAKLYSWEHTARIFQLVDELYEQGGEAACKLALADCVDTFAGIRGHVVGLYELHEKRDKLAALFVPGAKAWRDAHARKRLLDAHRRFVRALNAFDGSNLFASLWSEYIRAKGNPDDEKALVAFLAKRAAELGISADAVFPASPALAPLSKLVAKLKTTKETRALIDELRPEEMKETKKLPPFKIEVLAFLREFLQKFGYVVENQIEFRGTAGYAAAFRKYAKCEKQYAGLGWTGIYSVETFKSAVRALKRRLDGNRPGATLRGGKIPRKKQRG